MAHQKTLAREISISGAGIHTGAEITLTLAPAPIDHGIAFQRTDLPEAPPIPATADAVSATALATTLGSGKARVATVEHLLSAAAALRVDNMVVRVDGPEVPALDGSAAPFCKLIRTAGISLQTAPRKYLVVTDSFRVDDGDRYIEVEPAEMLTLDATIAFDHPAIGMQQRTLALSNGQFEREIADARTFGFLKEVDILRKNGFARGGALDNAVVLGDNGPVNSGGWKYPDEAVRHKILDLLGDLMLAGKPLVGYVRAYKPGHALHHKFVRELLAHPETWTVMTLAERQALRPTPASAPAATASAGAA